MENNVVQEKSVISVDGLESLAEVAEEMHESKAGRVILTQGRNGKRVSIGILSDVDIEMALSVDPDLRNRPVCEVMKSQSSLFFQTAGIC